MFVIQVSREYYSRHCSLLSLDDTPVLTIAIFENFKAQVEIGQLHSSLESKEDDIASLQKKVVDLSDQVSSD